MSARRRIAAARLIAAIGGHRSLRRRRPAARRVRARRSAVGAGFPCGRALVLGVAVENAADGVADHQELQSHQAEIGIESLEEVQKLLKKLPSRERNVVRLSYLEGRSYEEISTELNIPVNSIGPILSRARNRLRKDVIAAPPKRIMRREPEHFGR